MRRFWDDPVWVGRTPLLTVIMFESANLGQISRMVSYHTAAGQSLFAWVFVNIGLWLWSNFYRVITPEQVWARRMNRVGITLNSCVILCLIYFRYIKGRG